MSDGSAESLRDAVVCRRGDGREVTLGNLGNAETVRAEEVEIFAPGGKRCGRCSTPRRSAPPRTRPGWISSCSGRSVGGAFSTRRRVPIVLDPGRSAARHRAVVGCGSTGFPSSPRWTNVPLDVRSGCGSSCASRAALVVLVPVVEVWPLDAVRAVCGAGRIVHEALRRRPRPCLDPGRRQLRWMPARCCSPSGRSVFPARPDGRSVRSCRCSLLSVSGQGAASGWCSRWSRRSVRHGNATRRLVLLAAVEAVRRPGSGTGRVVVRGCVGSRRDAGWRVRLLDAGLLDVVRMPVLMAALSSFLSTAGSRGVLLDALALRSALRVSEDRFEGEIAPLNRELGPRKGQ